MPTKKQDAPESKLTRRDRVGLVVWTLALLLGIALFLVAAGAAFLYWKESVPHYEAGAVAELMALHTVEGNYLSDKKTYSASFLELNILTGRPCKCQSVELRREGLMSSSSPTLFETLQAK